MLSCGCANKYFRLQFRHSYRQPIISNIFMFTVKGMIRVKKLLRWTSIWMPVSFLAFVPAMNCGDAITADRGYGLGVTAMKSEERNSVTASRITLAYLIGVRTEDSLVQRAMSLRIPCWRYPSTANVEHLRFALNSYYSLLIESHHAACDYFATSLRPYFASDQVLTGWRLLRSSIACTRATQLSV
jgi:hypothetical protein